MRMSLGMLLVLPMWFATAAPAAEQGVLARWTFDEPSGEAALDSSGGGHAGRLLADARRVPGILGRAIELDGVRQTVEIPRAPKLKPPAQITVNAWVLPEDLSGNRSVYRKEDDDHRTMLSFQDGGRQLTLGLNVGGSYRELKSTIDPALVMDGRWHMVSGVYDGAELRTYVDGKQTAAPDGTPGKLAAAGKLGTADVAPAYVGSTANQTEFFSGAIDHVELAGRAWTAEEIAAAYARGAANMQPALAARAGQGAADLVQRFAPKMLAAALQPGLPVAVTRDGNKLGFHETQPGVLEHAAGGLTTQVVYEFHPKHNALSYQVRFKNDTDKPIRGLAIEPLRLRVKADPPKRLPRVRTLTGGRHYDGVYPSRAYELADRAFMTNDHSMPVTIGGADAREYVPMMQFALQEGSRMAGFLFGFEWSNAWQMEAGFVAPTYTGGPVGDFGLKGTMGLGSFVVPPAGTLRAPKVHIVFFEGADWTPLENAGRQFISDKVAWKAPPLAQTSKVTYDHWFGIQSGFTGEDMMRQAARAAELGCEYFCLDAGWYGKGAFGASGKGVWNEPDPAKFPGGVKDVQALSKLCRDRGMGFGLWAYLITKNGGGDAPFDLATPQGVDGAVATLRQWIKTYDMTWFRFEMAGSGDLNYQNGFYEVMERITKEYPDFHIECCLGGGMRFDLGMIRWCTSTWISDHTADADVSRFFQTGALRFWPGYLLNSAVRVHRNTGDAEATAYNFISRCVGAPSFNGDVAQWTPEATRRMRGLVDRFKSVRHLQQQPVTFPLPQVRSAEDWDVVCYGDGRGPGQLLYAFRLAGPERQFVRLPSAVGEWKLVMSSTEGVKVEPADGGAYLTLPPHSAAVWTR